MEDDRRTVLPGQDEESTVLPSSDMTIAPTEGGLTIAPGTKKKNYDLKNGDNIDGYIISKALSERTGEGLIYLAKKDGGDEVALKLYHGVSNSKKERVKTIAEILINNKHDNVVDVYGYGFYQEDIYVVMKYYPRRSINTHLLEIRNDIKKLKDSYISQLNEGLHFLHEIGIFHNDIKPANIYYKDVEGDYLVIGDFGVSSLNNGEEYLLRKADINDPIANATIPYLAPEGDEECSIYSDYYALGVTIMEMAHGEQVTNASREKNRNDAWIMPSNVDGEIQGLVDKLREFKKSDRITYEGVKRWVNRHNVYGTSSTHTFESYESLDRVKIVNGYIDGHKLRTTKDFLDFIISNWKRAITLYHEGKITDEILRYCDSDELEKTFISIRDDKSENDEIKLILTLLELSPRSVTMIEYLASPRSYIEYIMSNEKNAGLFSERLFRKIFELYNTQIPELIDKTLSSKYNQVFKKAMILNFYSNGEFYFLKGEEITRYEALISVVGTKKEKSVFFDNELNPLDASFLYNELFIELLEYKDVSHTLDMKEYRSIASIKDVRTRNGSLSVYLSNSIRFIRIGITIENPALFLKEYLNKVFDTKDEKEARFAIELIRSGKFSNYYQRFASYNKEIDESVTNAANRGQGKNASYLDLVRYILNSLNKVECFYIDNNLISNLNELFAYLSDGKESVAIKTQKLLKSNEFRDWLESKGLIDVLANLGGN